MYASVVIQRGRILAPSYFYHLHINTLGSCATRTASDSADCADATRRSRGLEQRRRLGRV